MSPQVCGIVIRGLRATGRAFQYPRRCASQPSYLKLIILGGRLERSVHPMRTDPKMDRVFASLATRIGYFGVPITVTGP